VKGADGLRERDAALSAWIEKLSRSRLQLEEWDHLRAIAFFLTGSAQEAGERLLAYLEAQGGPPNRRQERYLGDILLSFTFASAKAGEWEDASRSLPWGIRFHQDSAFLHRTLASVLRTADGPGATGFRDLLKKEVEKDPRLPPDEKRRILEGLAGPGSKGGTKRAIVGGTGGRPPEPGREFTGFTLDDLEGHPVSTSDYRGKVLLIDYWATWCRACIRDMPELIEVHRKYRGRGFEVLGVCLDRDEPREAIRQVAANHGLVWRQTFDGKGWSSEAARSNEIHRLPARLLLDRTGRLCAIDPRGSSLTEMVEKLLAEPYPPPEKTQGGR
jgi:thiol-disulfide isomerase/thioredoxin